MSEEIRPKFNLFIPIDPHFLQDLDVEFPAESVEILKAQEA